MCRIDFLGTGLCPAGKQHGYLAYWPCGRNVIYKGILDKRIIMTRRIKEIVDTCTMCGLCDKPCSFINNLQPTVVQKALKECVEKLDLESLPEAKPDAVLKELQGAVGTNYATNDPVILYAYTDTIHIGGNFENVYVALPRTAEDVAKIVAIAKKHNLLALPRASGTFFALGIKTLLANPFGMKKGIIIDTIRMKDITVDPVSQTATVQSGVTAFELQQAAKAHGLRACVGEADAGICVNIATFGVISTWGNTYGWGADLFTDAQVVDQTGKLMRFSDPTIPNVYAAPHGMTALTMKPSLIITEMTIKLHKTQNDEQAVFIPYEHLDDALDFAMDLAKRNIGVSLTLLSSRYFADFISPNQDIAQRLEYVLKTHLKTNYFVDIICTNNDRAYIDQQAPVVIDTPMVKNLILSAPTLADFKDNPLLKTIQGEENPMKAVFSGALKNLLVQALHPSADQIAKTYPPELRDFYTKLYNTPQQTDPIWLHENRVLSTRIMRQRMFINRGGYLRADKKLILTVHNLIEQVGTKYGLDQALGYICFIDEGKIAFIEYDYYYDHNMPENIQRLNGALVESLFGELSLDGIVPMEYCIHKGLHRKEHVFYPLPKALTPQELQALQGMVQQMVGG
jgi:hypothetical protein